VIIALIVIPVSRQDLSGARPAPGAGRLTRTRTWREAWNLASQTNLAQPSARTRRSAPERGGGQQAHDPGAGDGLGSGVRAELAVQVGDVGPDRVV
jgi:hypothetical protein